MSFTYSLLLTVYWNDYCNKHYVIIGIEILVPNIGKIYWYARVSWGGGSPFEYKKGASHRVIKHSISTFLTKT